ncbi:MAG: DUF3459 domain-containing protein [Chloroflexota bacterium]|nr:DUF3459 domain-containing protein [Chloroflexota bacterium]
MDDFIFGTLGTDALRLARLRQLRSGIVHFNQIDPLDPPPGQFVTITARVGTDLAVDRVTLYYTTDGAEPEGTRGAAQVGSALAMEPVQNDWDVLGWGYVTCWRAQVPAQADGTQVNYKIGAWSSRGTGEVFADNQAREARLATHFAFNVDAYRAPDWVWDAAIYHIFLDRFYPGDGHPFDQPQDPRRFYGGTLRGVIDKLGYMADLGFNCIWLSPCFASPTYHRYDASDYLTVDSRLGTNQDLFDLFRVAHGAGIRVLLDFTANHVSSQHPHFVSAQTDPNSPYRDWYTFRRWPNDYATFFHSKGLPQVNLENASARQWMIDNARYWLERGADGFRLDYANGPSHNFWVDFRRATRAVAPESFTVGEIVEAADVVRSYAGRLDGSLDFLFLEAARRFFAFDTLDAAAFDDFLSRQDKYFGREFVRPTFLDNHDMNRFLWIAHDDKARLRLAATCLLTLPQPPVVYYGTEVAMTQARDVRDPAGSGDAEARRPMLWDDRQDREMHAFYRRLLALRHQHPALRRGQRVPLVADAGTGVLAYALQHADDCCIVALNNSAHAHAVTIPVASLNLRDAALRDAFEHSRVLVEQGAVQKHLAARSAMVLEIGS